MRASRYYYVLHVCKKKERATRGVRFLLRRRSPLVRSRIRVGIRVGIRARYRRRRRRRAHAFFRPERYGDI